MKHVNLLTSYHDGKPSRPLVKVSQLRKNTVRVWLHWCETSSGKQHLAGDFIGSEEAAATWLKRHGVRLAEPAFIAKEDS